MPSICLYEPKIGHVLMLNARHRMGKITVKTFVENGNVCPWQIDASPANQLVEKMAEQTKKKKKRS